jgi:hypothetical protein
MADPFNPDPSIPLQAGAGIQQAANPMMGNPVSTMTGFAQVQNLLNQNRLFQQTFAARQRLGEIMSTSPDLDTAMQRAEQDPVAAPWAPQVASTVMGLNKTTLEMQGQRMGQAQTGMEAVLQGLRGVYNSPTNDQWQLNMSAALQPLSPVARAAAEPYVESMRQGLMKNLPADQAAAAPMIKQRIAGLLMSSNITPEMLRQMTGQIAPQFQAVQGPQGQAIPGVVSGTGQFNPLSGPPMAGSGGPMSGATPTGPANTAPSPLTGSPGGLIGPTTTATAEMAATGKAGGDINTEMANRAEQLPGAIKRLDIMSGTLGQFQAGGGADFRAQLGKSLQALRDAGVPGISDDTINQVANSSLPATQLFNAEVKPLVISQLKEAAQGTGRVMRSEVDAFLGMMDGTNDPRALTSLLNQARYSLQVGYDQSQKFTAFKQALRSGDPSVRGLDMADFYGWYNKQMQPQQLPGTTGGGMQLGPTPASNVLGTTPTSKVTGPLAPPQVTGSRPPLNSFVR